MRESLSEGLENSGLMFIREKVVEHFMDTFFGDTTWFLSLISKSFLNSYLTMYHYFKERRRFYSFSSHRYVSYESHIYRDSFRGLRSSHSDVTLQIDPEGERAVVLVSETRYY